MDKQAENLKAELEKIGIHNERELADAIEALPPLNLYIMTGAVIPRRERADNG